MYSADRPDFIPPHGHYQELLSYQKAEVVYDLTFNFCERFLKRGDCAIDRMIQAARSGKQNIAEGSQASGGSKEMDIKLRSYLLIIGWTCLLIIGWACLLIIWGISWGASWYWLVTGWTIWPLAGAG